MNRLSGTDTPYFWFDSRTHRKAMAYLGYGLSQGEGFVVITVILLFSVQVRNWVRGIALRRATAP